MVTGTKAIWVESLARNFPTALDLMERAIRDCTDDLWHANVWEVPDPDTAREVRGSDGNLVTDRGTRRALVQLYSTPWAIAWHALERLDFMLTGGFVPWTIWPGFEGRTGFTSAPARSVWESPYGGLDVTTISEPWSRTDLVRIHGVRARARRRHARGAHRRTSRNTPWPKGRALRRPSDGQARPCDRARVADPAVHHVISMVAWPRRRETGSLTRSFELGVAVRQHRRGASLRRHREVGAWVDRSIDRRRLPKPENAHARPGRRAVSSVAPLAPSRSRCQRVSPWRTSPMSPSAMSNGSSFRTMVGRSSRWPHCRAASGRRHTATASEVRIWCCASAPSPKASRPIEQP